MPHQMKSFSSIINEITGGVDPLCSVKEIAGVMRVHEQTVYGYKNDHTEPTFSRICDLSHYLIKEYSYFGLAVQFMLPCSGRSNGKIQDELISIYDFGTDVHRTWQSGDKGGYDTAVAGIKAQAENLRIEGKQRWGS